MNRITLIGRLTANPELKYTPSGAAVCSFTKTASGKQILSISSSGTKQRRTAPNI